MGIIIERLASAGGSRPHGFRRLFSEEDDIAGEAALRASREFISTLDRSPLGTFAIDKEVLVAVQARERMDYEEVNKSSRAGWVIDDHMHYELSRIGRDMTHADEYASLRAEVMFWWSIIDTQREHIGKTVDIWLQKDPAVAAMVEKLYKVYGNPDKHDFYRAGFWDNDTIEHCISHGIDPEMATSLSYH